MSTYTARSLYAGDTAAAYDIVRTASPSARRRWNREMSVVDAIVQTFPNHSRVCDLPCGTGRFHSLLMKYGCEVVGGDISLDMIHQARLAAGGKGRASGLVSCDAEQLPFVDRSFDYLLCMRFYNLIPAATASSMLKEAARVTRRGVIVQVRFGGHNPLLRTVSRLRQSIGRGISGLASGPLLETAKASGANKRFPLPEFSAFVETARRSGLKVMRVHHVGSLLEPDPLRICELEHQ